MARAAVSSQSVSPPWPQVYLSAALSPSNYPSLFLSFSPSVSPSSSLSLSSCPALPTTSPASASLPPPRRRSNHNDGNTHDTANCNEMKLSTTIRTMMTILTTLVVVVGRLFRTTSHSSSDRVEDRTQEERGRHEEGDA